jgi:hypothetical protein
MTAQPIGRRLTGSRAGMPSASGSGAAEYVRGTLCCSPGIGLCAHRPDPRYVYLFLHAVSYFRQASWFSGGSALPARPFTFDAPL